MTEAKIQITVKLEDLISEVRKLLAREVHTITSACDALKAGILTLKEHENDKGEDLRHGFIQLENTRALLAKADLRVGECLDILVKYDKLEEKVYLPSDVRNEIDERETYENRDSNE